MRGLEKKRQTCTERKRQRLVDKEPELMNVRADSLVGVLQEWEALFIPELLFQLIGWPLKYC